MSRRGWRQGRWRALVLVLAVVVVSACAPSTTGKQVPTQPVTPQRADFPTVDPSYIYDQLFTMVTQYQHREAGYDDHLPVAVNGHDELAAYWTREMTQNLAGFAPHVLHDPFAVQGWQNRPATVPAFNVEVSVPGAAHPEQVVVIGCHYDGEAVSTQSANDDASGCAIELGVAKALATYWREHHVYPARTLRFVIFDAEEQGLYGSFHYLNSTINGDVGNLVAMFNEEQNGIAYPLRYLGKLANPLYPFFTYTSPSRSNQLYPAQGQLPQTQRDRIARFSTLLAQATPAVFDQFQAIGFSSLTYAGGAHQTVEQPVFTRTDAAQQVRQADDTLGSSDQVPFTLAGLPCATFVGNSTYYDQHPSLGSYPYDQATDTIQLMNTFASGSAEKAPALELSLALPGMLTTWMLHQPDILGEAAASAQPIVAISDVGQTVVGQSIALDARATLDPAGTNGALIYDWSFGDGGAASGISVSHTYAAAGDYALALTVHAASGTTVVRKTLHVGTQPVSYANPYVGYQPTGSPPTNPAVTLPTPVAG